MSTDVPVHSSYEPRGIGGGGGGRGTSPGGNRVDSADGGGGSSGGLWVGVETVMEFRQVRSPSNPDTFSGCRSFLWSGLLLSQTTRHHPHPSLFVLFGSRIAPRPPISFSFARTDTIV